MWRCGQAELDDPDQGLSRETLDWCDVLIYWDHARHQEVSPEQGQDIAARIKSGQLSLIALHSAHWSRPFVEAMCEVTRERARQAWAGADKRVEFDFVKPPEFVGPKVDDPITPRSFVHKFPDGLTKVTVYLPNCAVSCMERTRQAELCHDAQNGPSACQRHPPALRNQRRPRCTASRFTCRNLTRSCLRNAGNLEIGFGAGALWRLGKGKVFYFRPGHETFPVFQEKFPLQIIDNAVSWLGKEQTDGQ